MSVALDIPKRKGIIVQGRFRKIQRASCRIFTAIRVHQCQHILHLATMEKSVMLHSPNVLGDTIFTSYREYHVVEKQHLVKLNALLMKMQQILDCLIPQS